jgi:hypothetical protein
MGISVIFLQIPVVVGNVGDAVGSACALRAHGAARAASSSRNSNMAAKDRKRRM